MSDKEENQIIQLILDATHENIQRTRRTFLFIIGLTCISLAHLYIWYSSWDLARIAGRKAILARIDDLHGKGKFLTGNHKDDQDLMIAFNSDIASLEKNRGDSHFAPPLLGFAVGINDFTVVAQMSGVAVLIWLVFNQRRLNFCLRQLERRGWELPKALLELHFGLVGSHADGFMKWLGRLLPLALPLTSMLFLLSDIYDLSTIKGDALKRLAFEDTEYTIRVFVRLGSGALLGFCVLVLGSWSYKEWRKTEDSLTKFSE